MRINKLKLNYFGKFHDLEIDLEPGINIIYGDNEAGKSTIHTFIKGMLFGIDKLRGRAANSKDDLYNRYLPWSNPGAFSGSMEITVKERQYRLQRSFHTADKHFTITDMETGRVLDLKDDHISQLIPELTESSYNNTVSIGQLNASTDTQFASHVHNYIANLSVAKSNEVDVTKATQHLNNKKKSLNNKQINSQLLSLQELIKEEIIKEEKVDELTLKLRLLLTEEDDLIEQNEAVEIDIQSNESSERDRLPAILENYRVYKQKLIQNQQLELQYTEIQRKVSASMADIALNHNLKEDIKEAEQCKQELSAYKDKLSEKSNQKKYADKSYRTKSMLISLVPTLGIAFLLLLLNSFKGIAIPISIFIIAIGFIIYNFMKYGSKGSLKSIDDECEDYARSITNLQSRLNHIYNLYNVDGTEGLSKKQEEYLEYYYFIEHGKEQLENLRKSMDDVEDSRDELYEILMKYMLQFITEDILTDETIEKLSITVNRQKEEIKHRQSEVSGRLGACRLQIERLRWELSTLEDNEKQLQMHNQKYDELINQQREDEVELEAVKLALDAIQELSVEIHDGFGKNLNDAVSNIMKVITESKYDNINLDERMDIKVGIEGDYIPLHRLSVGTIDQMYLALRLAVADIFMEQEAMPLLLDDSFAFYDDERLKSALLCLADRPQVLLFSCHRREQRILEELHIPYNKVLL